MANLTPAAWILIVFGCVIVALLIGYFIGSRFGGKKSVAMREVQEKHDGYRNDVREHFEQTSAIMSRMVEDYRDMYKHMAEGADKLADMHPERLVTPPPAPEAITEDVTQRERALDKDGDDTPSAPSSTTGTAADSESKPAQTAAAAAETGPNSKAVMNSDSSNDRPWNKEENKKSGLE